MPSSTPGTPTSSRQAQSQPNMTTNTQRRLAMSEIGLFAAIYSARSIRRLKPDAVPEELITQILDAAIRAPSGGNAQSWAFLVVRDPDLRQRLRGIYRQASDIAAAIY